MKKIRLITLVLLAAVLLCSCVSETAGNDKNTTLDVTTAQKTEDPDGISELYRELDDNVPNLNFDGETFRFLTLKSIRDVSGMVYDDEIWVDELNSEPLNDAIYNRNMYVMERFNCKIENELAVAEDIAKKLELFMNSDEDVYQVVGFEAAPSVNFSLDGYFHDVNAIENNYIDFDAPWWSSQFFESTGVNDRIFVLAGALSLSMTRSIHVTYFNKRIADEQKVEDLYTVVNDGRWTIDYQTALTSGMYRDVNGDSERDVEDVYGFCSPFYWSTDSYWSAFDIDILGRNNDGEFELVLNEEKAYDGLMKILALCYGDGSYTMAKNEQKTDRIFVSGNVFMITQKLACAELPEYRNMQDDYGILHMPKFDEKQKEYYSMPYEIFQTYVIPKTNVDPAPATAILEALCAETWRKVIPTYSELVLKGNYLSDPQSRTKVDAGIMYYLRINNIASSLYRYPAEINKPSDFTSNLASKGRRMKFYLDDFNKVAFGG